MLSTEELEEFANNQANINSLIIKALQEQNEAIAKQANIIHEQTEITQYLFKEIKSLKEETQ